MPRDSNLRRLRRGWDIYRQNNSFSPLQKHNFVGYKRLTNRITCGKSYLMSKLTYKIYFYKTSSGKEIITNFIDSFSNKIVLKIKSDIRLLQEYGLSLLSTSKVKKFGSLSNFYELRIKTNIQIRLFFAFVSPNTFLIVQGFIKKTQKTPINEIRTAVNRLKEFDIQ